MSKGIASGPLAGISVPSGTVLPFAGTTAPEGFLICDGSALNRTQFSELFSNLGSSYGVGDGSTTFNIPDLRGEFLRGSDNGRGVDSGRSLGSNQVDATAKNGLSNASDSHGHSMTVGSDTHGHWVARNAGGLSVNYPLGGSDAIMTSRSDYNDWDYAMLGYPAAANIGLSSSDTHNHSVTASSDNHSHTISGDAETRPRNVTVNYIIKY